MPVSVQMSMQSRFFFTYCYYCFYPKPPVLCCPC